MGHHCRSPNSIAVMVASTAILPALASPIANPSHIKSGSIGINITRNQDTAVAVPDKKSGVGERHCPVRNIIP
ncbi:hypothetical protein QT989_14400, partial [Microcoleus sp. SVA1_B6]|uniref:hypothetical protein n=1 Tax=Microcoleus sp. SVA1_B6 TaxID=2818952 RepID=UPI002FCE7274